MSLIENPQISRPLVRLTHSMMSYMESGTARYTEKDVEKCRSILFDHVNALELLKDKESAMALVKKTILQLNSLNEHAGNELIETDQREDICEVILQAGSAMGFHGLDEDVTEEWREW